jgi:hypothetical protein
MQLMLFEMKRAGEAAKRAAPKAWSQKQCQRLRTPIYPTPSSPLSRLQPYVLPSECAGTHPEVMLQLPLSATHPYAICVGAVSDR